MLASLLIDNQQSSCQYERKAVLLARSYIMAYCMFLGNGFEDVEALAVVDILRRARVPVDLYGIGAEYITSRSQVVYKSEKIFKTEADIDLADNEGLLLPGGPAVDELVKNNALLEVIRQFHAAGKLLFA